VAESREGTQPIKQTIFVIHLKKHIMEDENKKTVASEELEEKVKNEDVKVEAEEISDKELNDVAGGGIFTKCKSLKRVFH
jgi:hypothetical protein